MTTTLTSSSATPSAGAPAPVPVTPRSLEWLTGEVEVWRGEGLISDVQARQLLGRYQASRRFSLATLVLTLGAVFVGIGLIWLVAANLDRLPPVGRFAAVALIWVAITLGAEVLAGRREHGGPVPSPVVGAARLLAALAFGAVIFQAAQSLQVPAYEPRLVGLWGAAALVYAYATHAVGPLLVGLAAGSVWFVWQVLWDRLSPLGAVLAFAVLAVAALSLAALQERRLPRFAVAWRELGLGFVLITLFIAAVPQVTTEDFSWTGWSLSGVIAAGVLAAAGIAFGGGRARLEPVGALVAAGVAVLLVLWDSGTDVSDINLADWASAAVAIAVYVAAAGGVAVLGALRDSWRLTAMAMIALVVFTTFQSFAVFSAILPGAWLFVALGLVFLTTGYLFDRARRRLALELTPETPPPAVEGDPS